MLRQLGQNNERSFDSQATWLIDELSLFFRHVVHGCLYNQTLADIRSTGAGIMSVLYLPFEFDA